MKRMMQLAVVAALGLLTAAPSLAAPEKIRTKLSGSEQVPPVKTPARGELRLIVRGQEISYELSVSRITSPTAASIHLGRKGENGPPVAGIFGGPPKVGPFRGMLATGVITDKRLTGELQGKRVSDLLRLIREGRVYVNVLTATHPAGEIRGQIK